MKMLLFFVMFISAPLVAEELTEQTIPIYCGPSENILNGIKSKFSEEVMFMAADKNQAGHDIFHSLWLNYESNTWSFIVINKQLEKACIMASGINGKALQAIGI